MSWHSFNWLLCVQGGIYELFKEREYIPNCCIIWLRSTHKWRYSINLSAVLDSSVSCRLFARARLANPNALQLTYLKNVQFFKNVCYGFELQIIFKTFSTLEQKLELIFAVVLFGVERSCLLKYSYKLLLEKTLKNEKLSLNQFTILDNFWLISNLLATRMVWWVSEQYPNEAIFHFKQRRRQSMQQK